MGWQNGMALSCIESPPVPRDRTIKDVCFNNRGTRLSGAGISKSHIREDYATLLSTLDERHAIVFGRASSCTEPVLVRPNEASKSPSSSSSWTKFRSTNETESGETCSTTVTGMCWRWSGWSRLWKDWPESLHDAVDSG